MEKQSGGKRGGRFSKAVVVGIILLNVAQGTASNSE